MTTDQPTEGNANMATRKDEAPASNQAEKSGEQAIELQPSGHLVPVLTGDGVGQFDEKVNPGQDELQETVDKANEKGYLGVEADPTPDEHYSVSGVVAGKPTPENPTGQKPGRV